MSNVKKFDLDSVSYECLHREFPLEVFVLGMFRFQSCCTFGVSRRGLGASRSRQAPDLLPSWSLGPRLRECSTGIIGTVTS